jgi:fluoride exporter
MIKILAVGLGGFVGAIARYGLSGLAHRVSGGGFAWGTLLVNVLGCLAIGYLAGTIEARQPFSPQVRLFLLVGILGSLTTFSTFGHETFTYLESGALWLACMNILLNVALGLSSVVLGRMLA